MRMRLLALAAVVVSAVSLADTPTTRPAGSGGASAEQTMQSMLSGGAGSGGRPLQPAPSGVEQDATSGGGSVAPGARAMRLQREGTFIFDRTGRLSRGADGQSFEFIFDADSGALQDPPLVILPNLKLMAMEAMISASSRDLRFRITGELTEYKGRNHILLHKVLAIADTTQVK